MEKSIIKINKKDNVYLALKDLEAGEITLNGTIINLPFSVAQKHKFLEESLKKGEKVIMYGVPVGTVNEDLPAGSPITTQNTTHFSEEVSLANRAFADWAKPSVSKWKDRTFMGYHRSDGRVGTANYWLFIPLVFCENRNLKILEETLNKSLGYYKPNQYEDYVSQKLNHLSSQSSEVVKEQVFKNIDGLRFLYHQGGCGGTEKDSEALIRLLANYIYHPNVGGATILSLGCQKAQIDWFKEILQENYPKLDKPIEFLEQQELLTADNLIRKAIDVSLEGMQQANEIERKPTSISKLVVGLECGGSDGFSGISANPGLGKVSDILAAVGGSSILSEFPELYGVEQEMVNRSRTAEIAKKFLTIFNSYKKAAADVGSGFDMNPSPGNIKDGLITDAIKSAGAATKGGTSTINDVLDYTEYVTQEGLNLLNTPGNDVESTTGLAGAGANLILFTTGLGTPTGNPITPVIKVSSNTKIFEKMDDIIDVNAGKIISGEQTLEEFAEELLEYMLNIASGIPSKAMQLEQYDFIPWKRGVSL